MEGRGWELNHSRPKRLVGLLDCLQTKPVMTKGGGTHDLVARLPLNVIHSCDKGVGMQKLQLSGEVIAVPPERYLRPQELDSPSIRGLLHGLVQLLDTCLPTIRSVFPSIQTNLLCNFSQLCDIIGQPVVNHVVEQLPGYGRNAPGQPVIPCGLL